jgi:hypothetical protein
MHIDLIAAEAWEDLGDELKKNFPGSLFPADNQVQLRSYKSVGHAAYEASQTLIQIFSHKKAVAYVKGLSPAFEFLVPQYLKDAFQVQTVEWSQLTSPQTWVDGLKKDTNFVLMAEDHPVTGELYETNELDKILNDKKIFSIRVSHARHFHVCEEVRGNSARILSFGPDLAVTLFGSRFKAQTVTAAQMGWDKQGVIQKIQRKRKRVFDQSLVEHFESEFTDWKYFKGPAGRLFDRAVLVFPGVNGDAMVNEIATNLSLNKNSISDALATTSQFSWEDPVSFKGWWLPTPTPEEVRGLVVFSAEILTRKDFANLVKTSYDKVMSLQKSFSQAQS